MQGTSVFRPFAVLAIVLLAACSNTGSTNTAQTPAPSNTTLAQANSTAAPDQALSKGPGSKYYARTYALDGVQFEVWANGRPIASIQWPNKSVEISTKMRGHVNNIAIKWTKMKKSATGMLSITGANGAKLMTAVVTHDSPPKAQITHAIVAPQAPTGNSSTNQ